MSETLQYKFNTSDYLYTNPDYEVYNLTDFDKNAECMILITNRNIQSGDSDVEILEPKSSSKKRKYSFPHDHDTAFLSDNLSDQSFPVDNKIVDEGFATRRGASACGRAD